MYEPDFETETLRKETFTTLDPKIRCVALTGYFLRYWAVLEATLNNAIERALDLTAVQGAIVTKNMQLNNKISILKTLVGLRAIQIPEFSKTLDDIQKVSQHRNMIAHDLFLPDDKGDGVQFVVAKVKGKLSFPTTRWSIDDFLAKYADIHKLTNDAETMAIVIADITVRKLIRDLENPNNIAPGLGLLNPLVHNLPEPSPE